MPVCSIVNNKKVIDRNRGPDQTRSIMPKIEFTQYVRPYGKAATISIDRPESVHSKAVEIVNAGFFLEAEVLPDGTVSLTVADNKQDLSTELVENGPSVIDAVDRLILEFDIQGQRD